MKRAFVFFLLVFWAPPSSANETRHFGAEERIGAGELRSESPSPSHRGPVEHPPLPEASAEADGRALARIATEPGSARDVFGFRATRTESRVDSEQLREPPFPFLPGEDRQRSYSIGTVTTGYVVNARQVRLPGEHWDILPRQLARGLDYGTDEVIEMIEDAARHVSETFGPSTLWLGNIGRHGGGDIPWSVSHNAGRDADLAFYTTDPSGAPVQPPGLIRYGDNGRSMAYGGYYRFDVERNWVAIRSMLRSQRAQVQFLFISNGLRRMLLQHARALGEPASLIERAETVLRQPGAEIPHDDHLHLRIFCTEADKRAGCVNTGRVHPGVQRWRSARGEAVEDALGFLRDADAETRGAAIERLVVLRERSSAGRIEGRLSDPSPRVRQLAARALGELGGSREALALIAHYETEREPIVREAVLRSLGELGGAEAVQFLRGRLRSGERENVAGKRHDLRLAALDSLAHLEDSGALGAVIPLLESPDRALRLRAERTLRLLGNADPTEGAAERMNPAELRDTWNEWLESRVSTRRETLLAEGFAALGYGMTGSARDQSAELARAAGDSRAHVRINAQRTLMEITNNYPRSLEWSRGDARIYWTRWVRRNPGRIASGLPRVASAP